MAVRDGLERNIMCASVVVSGRSGESGLKLAQPQQVVHGAVIDVSALTLHQADETTYRLSTSRLLRQKLSFSSTDCKTTEDGREKRRAESDFEHDSRILR